MFSWMRDNLQFVVECIPNYSPLQVNFSCLNNFQSKNVIDDTLVFLDTADAMSLVFLEHVLCHLILIWHSDKMIVQEHAILKRG